mmetsp:Transcript_7314/g.13524  ORF Transcript_7314/g.13524 Transcript_7314/m.13524 type:complete len:259 (-) Transcript_7314:2041-2817(-)
MQVGHTHSLWKCITQTAKYDGFAGFYQGVAFPLYSVPLLNAVIFGAYAHANSLIGDTHHVAKGVMAGAYAGLINCVIVCPVELVKCRMQIQSHVADLGVAEKYHTSFQCAKHIVKTQGFLTFYTGMISTIYREVPAYAAQFVAYEISCNYFKKKLKVEELPLWAVFISGTLGGLNCWLWSYPQDVVKTHIQVQEDLHSTKWDGGFKDVSKHIWKEEGLRGFWKGFSPCAIRAMIANGFGFLAYEVTLSLLQKYSANKK